MPIHKEMKKEEMDGDLCFSEEEGMRTCVWMRKSSLVIGENEGKEENLVRKEWMTKMPIPISETRK